MAEYVSPDELEAASKLAPNMDATSLGVFAGSAVMRMMLESAEYPVHNGNTHNDVTGYFSRKRRSR